MKARHLLAGLVVFIGIAAALAFWPASDYSRPAPAQPAASVDEPAPAAPAAPARAPAPVPAEAPTQAAPLAAANDADDPIERRRAEFPSMKPALIDQGLQLLDAARYEDARQLMQPWLIVMDEDVLAIHGAAVDGLRKSKAETEIEQILDTIARTPESDYTTRLRLYGRLTNLDRKNEDYRSMVSHYHRLVAAEQGE